MTDAVASKRSNESLGEDKEAKKRSSMSVVISPSILSSDFAILAQEAARMEASGADALHVDVMDGHFVPNLTLGAPIVKSLRAHTKLFLDCHLMVSRPEQWVKDFAQAGADQYTFHIEATEDPAALIKQIKEAGMKVGIALKPKTPAEAVFPFLDQVDLVLVMTVEPGFGGQKFMEDMMPKVRLIREKKPDVNIQVDGGLDEKTIKPAAAAGANNIVAGTSIFKSPNATETITVLRNEVLSQKASA